MTHRFKRRKLEDFLLRFKPLIITLLTFAFIAFTYPIISPPTLFGHTSSSPSLLFPTRTPSSLCSPSDLQASTPLTNITTTESCSHYLQQATIAPQKLKHNNSYINSKPALLLFHHLHKAGGSTLCNLAQLNMFTESITLPNRNDSWNTNCIPYQIMTGMHPTLGKGGGACWLANTPPPLFRTLPSRVAPLNFVASEGALPDAIPLDILSSIALVTMLRNPLDRVVSSYKWWKYMTKHWPLHLVAECRAYVAPPNATFEEWLTKYYPDNWMTRELAGASYLLKKGGAAAALSLLEEKNQEEGEEEEVLRKMKQEPVGPDELEKAKARLHLFSAILLTEKWDESVKLMNKLFGWKELDYMKHRKGSRENTSAQQELSPETLELLKKRNTLDMQLYEYAVHLHNNQVSTL